MSVEFYTFMHIFFIMMALVAVAGIMFHMIQGGTKENLKIRKQLSIMHGVSLTLAFVAGFGLMARMHYNFGTAQWLYVKLACWLLIGAFPALLYRKLFPKWANFVILIAVVGAALYAVTVKPF